MQNPGSIIGSSPIRKEGLGKVTGRAEYVDDIVLPGMWHGATVRSTIARGRIRSIAFDPAVDWAQFCVVTAAEIPGENVIVHLTKDHPCLAAEFVNHPAEPILLIAHPDKAALHAAVEAVKIAYEEQPGVFTIEDSEAGALAESEPGKGDANKIIWNGAAHGGAANTFKTFVMRSGDDAAEQVARARDLRGDRRRLEAGDVDRVAARARIGQKDVESRLTGLRGCVRRNRDERGEHEGGDEYAAECDGSHVNPLSAGWGATRPPGLCRYSHAHSESRCHSSDVRGMLTVNEHLTRR